METIQTPARRPCKRGHLSPRNKSGNCIQCEKERYHSNPERKEYTKKKSAERRAKIKSDPQSLEKHREYMREYARRNRQSFNNQSLARYKRNKIAINLRRKKVEATDEIVNYIKNHSGDCDLCGAKGDGKWETLCIDHCHKTNQFRGLLCNMCNKGIGLLRDDGDLMRKAAAYVEHYR